MGCRSPSAIRSPQFSNILNCAEVWFVSIIHLVTYWPSTKTSIKRYTCVTAKQVHPVEDIRISPWPVHVVGFGADAYAHRKQVGVRQLYNQKLQTAWVSSRQFEFQLESVRDKIPEWEPAPDRGLRPSVTHSWATQPECERCAAMVRRTLGQYVAVYSRLQLTSHTQLISTLSNKVLEVYFFL